MEFPLLDGFATGFVFLGRDGVSSSPNLWFFFAPHPAICVCVSMSCVVVGQGVVHYVSSFILDEAIAEYTVVLCVSLLCCVITL